MRTPHRLLPATAVLLILAVYLVFADRLAQQFSSARNGLPAKFSGEKSLESAQPLSFSIDKVEIDPGSLFEYTTVVGWAHISDPSFHPAHIREVRSFLVFRNAADYWAVATSNFKRTDLYEKTNHPLTNPTEGFLPGYSSHFSPLPLKALGIYDLGIAVLDGDTVAGFSWTALRFERGRNGFRRYIFEPRISRCAMPSSFGSLRAYAFDLLSVQDDVCTLRGWAWADIDGFALDQEVVVILMKGGDVFNLTTEKYRRSDLRKTFSGLIRPLGDMLGFNTSLRLAELPVGTYEIGVLVNRSGKAQAFAWTDCRLIRSETALIQSRQR